MSFRDKVAIVTGAGQGIGLEICRQLAEQGANVFLNDIDPELTKKAAATLNSQYGHRVYGVTGDCSKIELIHTLVNGAIDKFGQLDVVIANAGITLFGDFFTYPTESFDKIMRVNLGGSFFLAQAAAVKMKLQASGGSILFMSSVTGHQAHKGLAAYSMSKAALEMLARNLVIELSQYGINVNTIAPGATLTERTTADKNYEDTWKRITPNGRPANVADIANAALFLVDSKSKHITGQNIIIDGGWTCVGLSPE